MTDATAPPRHPEGPLPGNGRAGDATMQGDGPSFDWTWLVPRVVHPTKVAVIEAMTWIGRPLSATELELVFGEEISLGLASYHMKALAKLGVVVEVSQRPVRGAMEHFYVLSDHLRSP